MQRGGGGEEEEEAAPPIRPASGGGGGVPHTAAERDNGEGQIDEAISPRASVGQLMVEDTSTAVSSSSLRTTTTGGGASLNLLDADAARALIRTVEGRYPLVAEPAGSLLSLVGAVRCNGHAARLLALRVQEALGALFFHHQQLDDKEHAVQQPTTLSLSSSEQQELITRLEECNFFLRTLSRPGYLPVLLSGRAAREGWEALDGALLKWTNSIAIWHASRQQHEQGGEARSYHDIVVNVQALVLGMGGLQEVGGSQDSMRALADAIQAQLDDLQEEVANELAAIQKDTEAIVEMTVLGGADQLHCLPITHPGFRRLWVRHVKEPVGGLDAFLAHMEAFLGGADTQQQHGSSSSSVLLGQTSSRIDALLGDGQHRRYLKQSLDLDQSGLLTASQLSRVLRPLSHLETVYQATSFLIGQRGRRVLLPAMPPDLRASALQIGWPLASDLMPLLRSPGMVNLVGPRQVGKTHLLTAMCHELSRTDALQGDIMYVDASSCTSAVTNDGTRPRPDLLVSLLSSQLGLTCASLHDLPLVLPRFVKGLRPGSVVVIDHVDSAVLSMLPPVEAGGGAGAATASTLLHPLHAALADRAAHDIRYVLVSHETLIHAPPRSGGGGGSAATMEVVVVPPLSPEQCVCLCSRLFPLLDPVARDHIIGKGAGDGSSSSLSSSSLAGGLPGRVVALARLPGPVLYKIIQEHQQQQQEEEEGAGGSEDGGGGEGSSTAGSSSNSTWESSIILQSMSRSHRDFLHHLGPLFAVGAPFEDRLALQLLGQRGGGGGGVGGVVASQQLDALERASMWHALLSLGVARRTDEGLFVLEQRYALAETINTSSALWACYLRYWAESLAATVARLGSTAASVIIMMSQAAPAPPPTAPSAAGEEEKRGEGQAAATAARTTATTTTVSDGLMQAALSQFDRWRPHYEVLLAHWTGAAATSSMVQPSQDGREWAAGQLSPLLSRRLPPDLLLSVLESVASSIDKATNPELAIHARNDQVAALLGLGGDRWCQAALGPAKEAVELSSSSLMGRGATTTSSGSHHHHQQQQGGGVLVEVMGRACLLAKAQLARVYEGLGQGSKAIPLYEDVVMLGTSNTTSTSSTGGGVVLWGGRRASSSDVRLSEEAASRLQDLLLAYRQQQQQQQPPIPHKERTSTEGGGGGGDGGHGAGADGHGDGNSSHGQEEPPQAFISLSSSS